MTSENFKNAVRFLGLAAEYAAKAIRETGEKDLTEAKVALAEYLQAQGTLSDVVNHAGRAYVVKVRRASPPKEIDDSKALAAIGKRYLEERGESIPHTMSSGQRASVSVS